MPSIRLVPPVLIVTAALAFDAAPEVRAVSAPPPAERSAPGLESVAPMSIPRMAHTATTLRDGRVLIAGGSAEAGKTAHGAELFDAATMRFAPLPPMVTMRYGHTATLLPDGKVLIAGGYGAGTSYLGTAELFDPSTNTFSPTGPLNVPRADHVAVLLDNGKVLLIGGVGTGWTFLSSAELYDPATGRFTRTGSMTVARESHRAVRLNDGRVFVVGGHRGRRADIVLYTSAEIYDPASGTFRTAGDMRVRRHKHDAVLLRDGRVLITGGSDERDDRGAYNSTELFDPRSGTFTMGPPMRLPRYKHQGTSVVLRDGTVIVGGGAPQAEILDAAAQAFSIVPGETRMAGQFSAVAALPAGGVLITGGYGNGAGPRASAWWYQP